MTNNAAMIDYASDNLEQSAERLLRSIVAGASIVFGTMGVIHTAVLVGLSQKWLASPRTMAWGFSGSWDVILTALQTLAMCATVLGGVLLARRSRASITLLRAGATLSILIAVMDQVLSVRSSSVGMSYWSTPATFTWQALKFLGGLWCPALLLLLTLPSLARRMV